MAILSVLDGAGASVWQKSYLYQSGTVVTSGGGIWVANALNIGETPGSGHSWDSLVSGEALIGTVTNGNGLTLTGTTLAMSGNPTFSGTVTATNVGCTAWSTLSSQSQTSNASANTYNQWITGWSGGGTNGAMTFGSSAITVTNAGTYAVSLSGTIDDTTSTGYTSFQIWSGGAVIAGGTCTIDTLLANQMFGFCISTLVTLTAGATLTVYFASSATSQSIMVGSAVFAAERLY